jgi:hypothetical protein
MFFRRRPVVIVGRRPFMRRRLMRRGCLPFFVLGLGLLAAVPFYGLFQAHNA